MVTIAASELQRCRGALERALLAPAALVIQRSIQASDGRGGKTATWSTVATVDAAISPNRLRTPQEKLIAERPGVAALFDVRVPVGSDVRRNDRLVIGGRTLVAEDVGIPHTREVLRRVLAIDQK